MTDRPSLDVARIVDEIRDEIQKRRAAGDLTVEDIEWLLERRLKASIAKARIDESLAARLLHESHDWNTDTGYEIRTTRTGFAGALIRAGKVVVRPFVRLYTDHILNRQSQINLAMWHVLLDAVERNTALEIEILKLRKEVRDLKDRA
ncbi:MAG: hypothetical protein K1Y01_07385 [Vicinamibacteria bacterium]|nr:hypothetical protein [Vicinamibacteria bacterium]